MQSKSSMQFQRGASIKGIKKKRQKVKSVMSNESDFAGELMNLCQYDLTVAVDWALIIKALPRVDLVHWHHM